MNLEELFDRIGRHAHAVNPSNARGLINRVLGEHLLINTRLKERLESGELISTPTHVGGVPVPAQASGPVIAPQEPLPYPPGATDQQKLCMDLWYLVYLLEYAACVDNPCRNAAWHAYLINVATCFPV